MSTDPRCHTTRITIILTHIFDEHPALVEVEDVEHVDEAVLVARVGLDAAVRVGPRLHLAVVGEDRRPGKSLGFSAWAYQMMLYPQSSTPSSAIFLLINKYDKS